MNTPISFTYYLEQAKQHRLQHSEYTDVCLEALRMKAKNVKSLEVISQEMDRIYTSMLAYKMAYEKSAYVFLDTSTQTPIRKMHKTLEGWAFPANAIVRKAMQDQGVEPADLPEEFSVSEREHIAQCYGMTYKSFCALPFVRPQTKKQLFKVLAHAESQEQTVVDAKPLDFVCRNDKLFYPQNRLATFLLTGNEEGQTQDREEVQQLLGKEISFVV